MKHKRYGHLTATIEAAARTITDNPAHLEAVQALLYDWYVKGYIAGFTDFDDTWLTPDYVVHP
jgi:hypothetical protein